MYIVISKPKRRSVAAGVVHAMIISLIKPKFGFFAAARKASQRIESSPVGRFHASVNGLIGSNEFHEPSTRPAGAGMGFSR
jgi:hypothetical protein